MEQEKALSLPVPLSFLRQVLLFSSAAVASFFMPFMLGHPQWLVGAFVNACLFLAAIYLPKRYYLPLIVLPSLGVLARGVIFGPLTVFLFYFLPFIWMGNLILIYLFKLIYSKTLPDSPKASAWQSSNFAIAVVIAAAGKFIFLFSAANIYLAFSIVPNLFLQLMGISQLADALAGGLIVILILKIYESRSRRIN